MRRAFENFILLLLAVAFIGIIAAAIHQPNTSITTTGEKIWRGKNFTLVYPNSLKARKISDGVNLNHQIYFPHPDPCDLEKSNIKQSITDFDLTIRLLALPFDQTVLTIDPLLDDQLISTQELAIIPDFIDHYRLGSLAGFQVNEVAGGCGRVIYFFPHTNQQTLIAIKQLVPELDATNSQAEEYRRAIPGLLLPETNEELFKNLLSKISFTN